jgi:hypothetical protein
MWTPDRERIVEHIAGVEDYPLNLTACARVIEDSRRLRMTWSDRGMRANDLHTGQANSLSRNPITGIADCCARAVGGHAAAAPPSSVMNSRRFTRSPRRRTPTQRVHHAADFQFVSSHDAEIRMHRHSGRRML